MGVRSYFVRIREAILKRKTDKIKIPTFKETSIIRKKLVFSGKVQGVGFRFETEQVCQRLGLTGWVRNKIDGRVEAEVQGKKEKITFLIDHLKSLKRMRIEAIESEELPVIDGEDEFKIAI